MEWIQPELPYMPPRPPAQAEPAAPYTVLLDPLTVAQAREAGRLMGQAGVTGRFVRGTLAEACRREAARKKAGAAK